METALQQMKKLVKILNKAAKAYYQEDREIMDNREYDSLYDQLEKLEKETGITLADSPTVNVGYEAVDFLPKETHESPMLSLFSISVVNEQPRAVSRLDRSLRYQLLRKIIIKIFYVHNFPIPNTILTSNHEV